MAALPAVRRMLRDNTGDWFSLNSNLSVIESHDHAYDHNSSILISGNQDNGVTQQTLAGPIRCFYGRVQERSSGLVARRPAGRRFTLLIKL